MVEVSLRRTEFIEAGSSLLAQLAAYDVLLAEPNIAVISLGEPHLALIVHFEIVFGLHSIHEDAHGVLVMLYALDEVFDALLAVLVELLGDQLLAGNANDLLLLHIASL